MIHVPRSSVPPPIALQRIWHRERQRAAEFYAQNGYGQNRYQFRPMAASEVRESLTLLFRGKCAYCESAIGPTGWYGVEHFRPRYGVVLDDGRFLPNHYWWLAGEWTNLYSACAACNRRRHSDGNGSYRQGDRFPLEDESTRASEGASAEEIAAERPMLLDPCVDTPEDHLVFQEDGTVVSDTVRGQTTIELIGLNRPELVEARRGLAETITTMIEAARAFAALPDEHAALRRTIVSLSRLIGSEQPYAALARQLVGAFRPELPADLRELLAEGVTQPPAKRRVAQQRHRAFVRQQESYSLARPEDAAKYRKFSRYVESVSIRNVRNIGSLDLDLTRSAAATAPWTVLLGENAAGKSTVLQAVTLALIGRAGVEQLGLDPATFIRRGARAKSGSVRVRLSGSSRSRTVRFGPDGFGYTNAEEPQTVVLAYGETRLLPGPGLADAGRQPWGRVEGLFRPARTLVDAEDWLRRADDEEFDFAASAIGDLLGLPPRQWLFRDRSSVWIEEHGRRVSVGELSTGWQSVLATVIDILEIALHYWPAPATPEGVVLIDEIGAHLHPRWRMRIVGGLRRMLPRMQFIVSTHEPLCLRGIEEYETVLMQRDERSTAFARTDLPSPRDLRVDQLLTSRHFGLDTTLDPDLDAMFDEYYQLLGATDAALNSERRARRDELGRMLQGQGVLGYTRRDQLVYEAIDTFLAAEQKANRQDTLLPLKETALQRVRELWDLVGRQDGTDPPS